MGVGFLTLASSLSRYRHCSMTLFVGFMGGLELVNVICAYVRLPCCLLHPGRQSALEPFLTLPVWCPGSCCWWHLLHRGILCGSLLPALVRKLSRCHSSLQALHLASPPVVLSRNRPLRNTLAAFLRGKGAGHFRVFFPEPPNRPYPRL